MIRGVYILPNLFTMGNLFCGFFAIISVIKGDFQLAATAIILANVFDILDGKIARLMKATSRFGMEFDSLADLVSFGVAPALLVFSWGLLEYGRFGWLAAFLFLACGALRLARYNVQADTADKGFFNGLPIPAAASMIATTVMIFYHLGGSGTARNVMVLLQAYALAFLMVSTIKYRSFKDSLNRDRAPFMALVLAAIFIIVIASEPQITLFVLCSLYAFSGPAERLLVLLGLLKPVSRDEESEEVM
ncbi:MAG: CDP-diacylglycerol--serine O-phosphatidyltransferase [Deltaproteobacteria bacterium]|nr:CDP-diacylglycerol--serine O-phosphatidyltransferase [Candidatus Anaeroferrophillus wilburensis]MBN2888077.1 CDP-diacylglycerol--serine O-phosphatidyltransferase [Deltaproteobacteria bacterium]